MDCISCRPHTAVTSGSIREAPDSRLSGLEKGGRQLSIHSDYMDLHNPLFTNNNPLEKKTQVLHWLHQLQTPHGRLSPLVLSEKHQTLDCQAWKKGGREEGSFHHNKKLFLAYIQKCNFLLLCMVVLEKIEPRPTCVKGTSSQYHNTLALLIKLNQHILK